jgi:hypothetical protein
MEQYRKSKLDLSTRIEIAGKLLFPILDSFTSPDSGRLLQLLFDQLPLR